MVTKEYYTLNEVSEILGKSKETLRRWVEMVNLLL